MKSDIPIKEEQSITKDEVSSIRKYFQNYHNQTKIVEIYPGKLVKKSGGVQVYKITDDKSDKKSREEIQEWWKTNAVPSEESFSEKFDI